MSSPADAGAAAPFHDLVVIGASAGGVEALRTVVADLPPDLPACVLLVLHLPRGGGSGLLPDILQRASRLPVRAAVDGEALQPGTVLVAPSDRHLVVVGDRVVLSAGPRENGHRPAVDATMRSAAVEHGRRVVGVVLSGNLDDGSAGLRAVARHGGLAVVQDPGEAMFPGMPRNALAAVPTALSVPLSEVGATVLRLVQTPVEADPPLGVDEARRDGLELASLLGHELGDEHPGQPSAFACPDCHGVLFDLAEGDVHRYRCRVGHAWSAESLVDRQGQAVESALWMALRSLEERGALARRVAASAVEADRPWSVQHFQARAEEAEQHAGVLRRLLLTHAAEPPPGHPVDDPGHDRGLGLLG